MGAIFTGLFRACPVTVVSETNVKSMDEGKLVTSYFQSEERTFPDSLPKILAKEYFSKPMHAIFRAAELRAYEEAQLKLEQPVLDLGCGNGAFGSVFCRATGATGLDLGSDLSAKGLHEANGRSLYRLVFQAKAQGLPVKSETMESILCNGVLCCIEREYPLALKEIARILKPNGQLVMTVPTPSFTSLLLPSRWFERLRLWRLRRLYSRKVNQRHGHRTVKSLNEWQTELDRAGLKMSKACHYFSGTEADWWSVLAMRPFQMFAILKCLPSFLQVFAIKTTAHILRLVPRSVPAETQEFGYLLIVARKL
jgi:ubiquinone/menaquinone biosynthesis C-methylase UbiE